MAFVDCRECGLRVSTDTYKCPNCGTYFPGRRKRYSQMAVLFLGVVIALIVFTVASTLSRAL